MCLLCLCVLSRRVARPDELGGASSLHSSASYVDDATCRLLVMQRQGEVKCKLGCGMWRGSHLGTRTLRAALFCRHSVCSAWQMAGRKSCRFWNAAPSCATCALRSAVTNMNTIQKMHVNASYHAILPHVSVVVTMCLIFTQPQGLSQISTTFASSLTCKS